MFTKILVAYDGSDGARQALEKAVEIAHAGGAELHLLAVGRIPEYAQTVSEVEEAREQAQRHYAGILEQARAELGRRGGSAQTHIDFGKPGDTIVRFAEEIGADLIILGVHPHSPLRRRVLGATADKVVDRAHCSVLVVKTRA